MTYDSKTIGILVLNRSGRHWLPALYDSIGTNGQSKVRIYLVDNASSDDSVSMTLQDYPDVKVIRMPRNLGYAMAYNLATPHALADGCEWIVWSNNDVILQPGCLTELVRAMKSDPTVGIAGPAFLAWEGNQPSSYMVGKHPEAIEAMMTRSSGLHDVDWVEGSVFMVSRRCIEDVGPLDPLLFLFWEDADFCRRARYKGYRVVLVPRALAHHYGGGTHQTDSSLSIARLRSRNHYVYQLANPENGFARNILPALHLFCVNLKTALRRGWGPLFLEICVFTDVLMRLGRIYRKWRNDRAGRHPDISGEDPGTVRVEVRAASG